jgi:urea transport system substrate-binding protein
MFGFRTTITLAVMAFVTALAALLILIQTRTFNLTTEQAASAYMDAASAKSFGRLQSQVAEIVTLVRVLSASPNLADSDQRTETGRGMALLKAALHALPQMDSVYVGYDNGGWLQVRNLEQVNNEQRERLRASPEAAFNIHLIRPTPTGALPLRRIFQDRLGDLLEQLDLWKYGYDARQRSWYRDTMRADQLLISSPYLSFTMATPVITVSAPLRGTARGVIAEGEESSRHIFYTGAAPNQQAIPAVRYLMSKEGGDVRRWVLLGTDYVYPRTTNRILSAYLAAEGVSPDDITTIYTPFGYSEWRGIVERIKAFGSEGKKTAVISTVNGDANTYFYRELADQQVDANAIPVMAFSIGERELLGADIFPVGHLAAWNYFQSINSAENKAFVKMWTDFNEQRDKITNDPMEATFIGFRMWAQAVVQAGTTNIDAVRQATYGQRIKAPSGFEVVMNTNHHLSKPVMIGKINSSGTFNVIWQSINPVRADAWSRYIPDSANRTADWTFPWVCGGCVEPTYKEW